MRFIFGSMLLCVFALAGSNSLVIAQDSSEIAELRKEIAALREELTQVRKERDELKDQLKKLQPGTAKNSERSEGAFNGIQWEITLLDGQGAAKASTKFYAQDGKIFKDGMEVGNYTDAGNRARMDVTKAASPRAIGTYNLLRVKNDPPTYTGTFKSSEGFEAKVILRAILD